MGIQNLVRPDGERGYDFDGRSLSIRDRATGR
jgi:hypothetical protein